jgi:hypothetical protein
VAEGTGLLRTFGLFRLIPPLSRSISLYPMIALSSDWHCPSQSASVAPVPHRLHPISYPFRLTISADTQ